MNQRPTDENTWDWARQVPPVSVVILAHNEEHNIAECLSSCAWCDDVHVLDSGSTDRTREIARSMGAKVHHNPFTSFGQQRNWAIDNIPTKHRWHFHLDADERFTIETVQELFQQLGPDGSRTRNTAYQCPSKMIFMGKWIRHSSGYPAYQVRFFDSKKCRFVDFGHGQRESTSGPIGVLRQPYLHYNFSKGLEDWFRKHNKYSTREAAEAIAIKKQGFAFKDLFVGNATARRRAIKNLSYHMAFRATLRFLYMYFLRGGWLDALPGFHYCAMIAMYEYWTELKIKESVKNWPAKTTARAEKLLVEPQQPPTPRQSPRVDVFIPTLNESGHIAETVANAKKLGDVYVLDSHSKDDTQELARAAGATVVEHTFVNYAAQKNWGLDNLPFTADWVFILDADERITPRLREEIAARLSQPSPHEGYFINRRMLIMGQEVRHGGLYPSWNLRLFKRGRARYEERTVHEHMVCHGPTDYMREPMLHIRRETIDQYINKHIHYAKLESAEWVKRKFGRSGVAAAGELFKHTLRVRQWLRREIWPQLPMRPLWRFLFMYVARLGILDGRAGWHLARLMFCYEYMISLLYKEQIEREEQMRRRQRAIRRAASRSR